jgi:DNA-binding GntR family transcriptional regulator
MAKPKPRTTLSLNAGVYARIRDAILEGQLPPGTPVSRRRLAEEFSVSTLPVTEALNQLEAEGFVESRPRAGTRVRVPTIDEIRGNYVLREALETHSARMFAEVASQVQRARILTLAGKLDRGYSALENGASEKKESTRHARLERMHVGLHIKIAEGTGCRELVQAIERSGVLLYNWLFTAAGHFYSLPAHWHLQLAKAITKGPPLAAAESMRAHVRFRMDDVMDRYSEYLATAASGEHIVRGPQRRTAEKNGMGYGLDLAPRSVIVSGTRWKV